MNKLKTDVREQARRLREELEDAIGHDWDRPLENELALLQRVYDGGLGAGRNPQDVEDAVRRFSTFYKLTTGRCSGNFDVEFWHSYAGKLLGTAYVWLYGDAMASLRNEDYTLEDVLHADGELIDWITAAMILFDIPERGLIDEKEAITLRVRIHNMLYPRSNQDEPLLTAYYTGRGRHTARVKRSEVLALKGKLKAEKPKKRRS